MGDISDAALRVVQSEIAHPFDVNAKSTSKDIQRGRKFQQSLLELFPEDSRGVILPFDQLIETGAREFGLYPHSAIPKFQLELANQIKRERFSSKEWNFQR